MARARFKRPHRHVVSHLFPRTISSENRFPFFGIVR